MTVNIMRDFPRFDTQKVQHCRLLLCLFKPFFELDDLKRVHESWPEAKERVDQDDLWDGRTKPFRLNIAAMLRQQIAADEETARRAREPAAASTAGSAGIATNEEEDEHFLDGAVDDVGPGNNVIESSRGNLLTKIFVADALDAFVSAGFPRDDNPSISAASLVGKRPFQNVQADVARISSSSGVTAEASIARQEKAFETLDGSRVASLGGEIGTPGGATPSANSGKCNEAVLEPYIIQLRARMSEGKSLSQINADLARRERNNEDAARSPIGALTSSQHVVTQRLANEYGLNAQQRLAFFLYANGMFAKGRDPNADSLRMYLGGAAGSGKSHTLKAMKAFNECPALRDLIPQGRFMVVAFQGKAASAVGGTTCHSVCQAGNKKKKKKGNLSKHHDGQQALTPAQRAHWTNAVTLVFEEVSMIGCELMVSVNEAAGEVFPTHKDKPFGNLVLFFCGDFNQLK